MADNLPDSEDDNWNSDPAGRMAVDRLQAEMTRAFAAPNMDYSPLPAADVIARNRN